MARHSRYAVTVSAAVAMRPCADCNSMEGHTSLSTALVVVNQIAAQRGVIPYEINQEKAKMFLTPSDFDKICHTY